MREILTIIACLLVALLTAALAGPWFIDWTAQRAAIEAQLSQALGTPVRTQGAIELKLLPTPRLVLAGVDAGGSLQRPVFRSREARFELAVAPLLRGELHFIEASLEAPELRIDPAAAAGEERPLAARLPEDVRFERIRIHNGSVTLVRANGDVTLSGINLDAEADSLAGPFKGSGTVAKPEGPVTFRFATGTREGERLRLKLVSDEAEGLPRVDLDGVMTMPATGVAAAAFDGAAVLSGAVPLVWRASGPLHLDSTGAASDGLDLRVGSEDAPLMFVVAGKVSSAGPRADLSLSARQIDLDRFLTGLGDDGPRLMALLRRVVDDTGLIGQLPMPVKLAVQSPTIQLGNDAITEASGSLDLVPAQPPLIALQASGPGRSRVRLSGFLEPGSAARYSGEVEIGARDLPRTAEWLQALWPAMAERLRLLPSRVVDVKGRAIASAAGFSADGLAVRIDRSTMTGAAAYTVAVGAERARLFADLNADALDLDGVPDLSTPGHALADTDVNLVLDARAVRLARFGQGMIDAGRIRLRMQKTLDRLRIEDFSIAGLGGANLTVSGDVRDDAARMDVRVDAQRLGDLAALIRRVAPGPWAEALASRSTALSPARLSFEFGARRASTSEAFQVTGLKLNGSLRDTRIDGSAAPEGGDVALKLAVDGADAPLVLRQIGIETVPLSGSGRARLQLTGRGSPEKGFDGTLEASVAGTVFSFSGHASGEPFAPQVDGTVRIKTEDAARLLRILAVALPDVTQSLPIDLEAKVATKERNIAFDGLTGRAAGTRLSGALLLSRDGAPRLTGTLDVDHASLPSLVGLLLGPPQPARNGQWSSGAFAPGLEDLLPVEMAMTTSDLRLTDKVAGKNARFTFRLAPGLLAFDEFQTALDRGSLAGGLVLRRDGQTASMSGALQLKSVPLERAGISGVLTGDLTFTSTGANAAALAAGLAGAGQAKIDDFKFTRADPRAPARVIAQADEGSIYISENDFVGALRRELDRAPQQFGERRFDLNMAAGVLRLASAAGQALSLDLRTLSVEARTMLTADPLPKDWTGPAPQLTIIDRDGARELDAGAFINTLAGRAITKEAARIEALEGDIRERAAFARRKRGLDFQRQRDREIAAYEAEQARLADEAARRAAEDQRRAAEDERRRLAEEERRRTQNAPSTINIVPAPPAPPPPFRAPPGNMDPSSAGRY